MTSAPDILAPYLVHFDTKPNAIESVQIYERCLNDIQTDYTERLDIVREKHDEVWFFSFEIKKVERIKINLFSFQVCTEIEQLKLYLDLYGDKIKKTEYDNYIKYG